MPPSDPWPRLYADLADLWPALSPPEHYAPEAARLRALIGAHFEGLRAAGRRRSVLELGAGGGHTLNHLRADFDCVAVDLSEAMLRNCRALNPDVPAIVGDMRTLRLGRKFDVVLVHDAVDYMTTPGDVIAAARTVACHLETDGVAFIAPTYTRETFVDGEVADDGTTNRDESGAASGTTKVLRASGVGEVTYFSYVHDPDPADDTMEMILLYLIRDAATRRVEVVEDRHLCGLFGNEQWLGMIRDVGLCARLVEQESGAWSLFEAVW